MEIQNSFLGYNTVVKKGSKLNECTVGHKCNIRENQDYDKETIFK